MLDTAERIYNEHAQALFSFLFSFTRNGADTRDLMREVFCKVVRKPNLLDGLRDERKFLLRLAHNLAVDLMRRRSVRQRNEAELAGTNLFAESPHADEACLGEALSNALQQLPPEQSAVAHLKLWEAATFEEIGRILNIPANTAASRYRYEIDKLRQQLRPLYDEFK